MDNPKYQEAVKHGRYTGNIPQQLQFYHEEGDRITFPRGWTRHAVRALQSHFCRFDVQDCRRELAPVFYEFRGQLRGYQKGAVNELCGRDHGVLEAATGSGKTVMAIAIIARRQQPTLILVHTKELLNQWGARIRSFLDFEPGIIGDGKMDIKPVSIATVQTARKHLDVMPEHFGHMVVDECHRTPSSTFQEVVSAFDAKYKLGLSATPHRRDGLGRLIFLTLGDRVPRVDPELLRKNGSILVPEIITRETDFTYFYNDDYPAMISDLTTDPDRNRMIARDIRRNANGGVALVVSDRVEHLHTLAGIVDLPDTEILTGSTPAGERARIVGDVNAGKVRVLFATVQLLGEGFDCPGLTDLYLTTPIRYRGRLIQVAGRILRPAPGKVARIYDYVDIEQPVLAAQARTRARALAEVAGIT